MPAGHKSKAVPVIAVICWLASMAGAYLLGSHRASAGGAAFFQSKRADVESAARQTFSKTGDGPESADRPPASPDTPTAGNSPGAAKANAGYYAGRLTA
ncbi:MAG: hypothetical protein EOP86_18495, partial [Verrucomicrobiaceae bacterium]